MGLTKVLIIDDDRTVRHIVATGLNGYSDITVLPAADGDVGLSLIESEKPSVVLLDVYLPNHNGLELFRKIRAIDRKLPVIFITGDTSSETAIQAMRAGAFDYLPKPLDISQIKSLTLSAIKARRMMDEPVAFQVGEGESGGERFIGKSKSMIEVYKSIGRVTAENVTVLIRGESGCGKELVARALVQHSDRADKPFVAVNCAAIPDQLLESELFGHEKGAFTGAERRRIGRFEQCDSGTIFLDEIGDMSTIIQGKVLRSLQEQKFERVGGNELVTTNVRILAATNRPLEAMVKDNLFREDLLYRLNGFTIDLPPLRERVVVSRIVEGAVETARPLIEERKQQLLVSMPPDPIWLNADISRMEQVLVNLLTNAAKYTAVNGHIWVTVQREMDSCVLRVRDNGVGISRELLPRIFDLFTQAERSLDRSQGGLGIGLALVQRLTNLHGGTVDAHSDIGQGSEFIIRVPVLPMEFPIERVENSKVLALSQRSLRVLVVDDNLDTVLSFSMLLRALGNTVYTAHDGMQAVQSATENKPDVILLDIGLPVLNGYEVARRIRLEPSLKHVVLIALTGYGQDADRQAALLAGFDHHLVKPARLEQLQKILQTVAIQ